MESAELPCGWVLCECRKRLPEELIDHFKHVADLSRRICSRTTLDL